MNELNQGIKVWSITGWVKCTYVFVSLMSDGVECLNTFSETSRLIPTMSELVRGLEYTYRYLDRLIYRNADGGLLSD